MQRLDRMFKVAIYHLSGWNHNLIFSQSGKNVYFRPCIQFFIKNRIILQRIKKEDDLAHWKFITMCGCREIQHRAQQLRSFWEVVTCVVDRIS